MSGPKVALPIYYRNALAVGPNGGQYRRARRKARRATANVSRLITPCMKAKKAAHYRAVAKWTRVSDKWFARMQGMEHRLPLGEAS